MSIATDVDPKERHTTRPDRLRDFITDFEALFDLTPNENDLLGEGSILLGQLVSEDNWLPNRYAEAASDRYSQYLLYTDDAERFSVVSFVWGPGQTTPIHDHTTWGLIGMLRGAEIEQHYTRRSDGTLTPDGEPHRLEVGAVDAVSPQTGDLHRVSNAFTDRTSISIHVYGGNIGKIERATYELDGRSKSFISGYSNKDSPSIWNHYPKLSPQEER